MSSRTVTQRNLSGGFLGGMLGMLAFGHLHAALLPVGCLLGVVIGWWYEVIGQSIADSTKLRVAMVKPRITRRWKATRVVATLLFLALNGLWVVPTWQHIFSFGNVARGSTPQFLVVHALSGMMISTIMINMTPILAFSDNSKDKHYRSYDYFRTHSSLLSVLRELGMLFRLEAIFALMFVLAVVWLGVVGVAFLFIFIIPISVAIGLVKGIYAAATQAGHWLCFGVTLVVTALCALLVSPFVANPYALYTAALATGVLSGIATEGVRRLLVIVLESPHLNRLVTEPLASRVRPSSMLYEDWMFSTFDPLSKLSHK